jgi:hypothetical protein
MSSILICRSCGMRAAGDLAVNQQELANVGMLELRCHHCGTVTRWGLAQDFRAGERRHLERRRSERRIGRLRADSVIERRTGMERRRAPVRKSERRATV